LRRLRAEIVTVVAMVTVIGAASALTAPTASAKSTVANNSPAAGSVKNWKQTYEKNLYGWCNQAGYPCNDVEGEYGTIDRVSSGYSNDGGYGAFVNSFAGKYHAVVSGTSALESGGCPNSGVEYCSGPYALINGTGSDSVFPKHGVTVSSEIYLDASFATNWLENSGCTFNSDGTVAGGCTSTQPEFDWDVSLNDNTGSYLQDFIITACVQGGNPAGGFALSVGYNSPGNCGDPVTVTQSGWYDFETTFLNSGGVGVVDWQVVNSSHVTVLSSQAFITGPSGTTHLPVTQLGGPNYIWFPTLSITGLPIDNTQVKVLK